MTRPILKDYEQFDKETDKWCTMRYRKTVVNPSENIIMLKSENNDGIVPHSHEFIELFYVSSGKGIHSIKGRSYIVSAGDLFIICTQDDHSLHSLSGEESTFQWINCIFLPEFIPYDFSIFSPECKYIGTEGFEMNYIFQTMIQEFQEKRPGYLDILKGYLLIVLAKLARLLKEESIEDYNSIKKKNYLKKAVEFIHSNYQQDIGLNSIASRLSVSQSYIGKIFREYKSVSPVNYINKYRIERSCKLLLETSYPAYRIAGESGFKDVKFFYTLFKRFIGLSPGEFRNKYAGSSSLRRI